MKPYANTPSLLQLTLLPKELYTWLYPQAYSFSYANNCLFTSGAPLVQSHTRMLIAIFKWLKTFMNTFGHYQLKCANIAEMGMVEI